MTALESIGFYTLSDARVRELVSRGIQKDLDRCELILTDRCNLRCPYCRGLKDQYRGDLPFDQAERVVSIWLRNGLRNVRFSGGEPTLWPGLTRLVRMCRNGGVEHIAISTNGTAKLTRYLDLIEAGVNDFSISLDAGCCATGEQMTGGVRDSWQEARDTIASLSWRTYVTVGMVFTEQNYDAAAEAIEYVDGLHPADIRIIPSAQYNRALKNLALPADMLDRYPILRYRINNINQGRHVRGIRKLDSHRCHLALDDMAVVGHKHYPCIIYLREQGAPIGAFDEDVRERRQEWYRQHDTHQDPICRQNFLDVCIDYNNRVEQLS